MMRLIRQVKKKWETFLCPKKVRVAVLAIAVVLAWLPAQAGQSSSQGKVLHIDARGLDLLLQSDPNLLLVDVRTPEELAGPLGRIPQSRNVPMQELEKNPEQFPRDKTLVLICRSGHRTLRAAGTSGRPRLRSLYSGRRNAGLAQTASGSIGASGRGTTKRAACFRPNTGYDEAIAARRRGPPPSGEKLSRQ